MIGAIFAFYTMSQALYRKWRSQTFDEVIGQEHVTQTLRNALRDGRIAHAYLFSGPRGTGKTSTARILAKALNCTGPEGERPCNKCPTCTAINEGRMLDLIEIDAASNNSVDDIRDLREKIGFRPGEGQFKIYIIDEVHMLSSSAFNALLKTLEEPPPHARFVLATTEPHKIPATVMSRCQRFDFRRIPVPEIAGHLQEITTAEGFQAEDEALTAIARSAQGCMRDAISLLDQMLSYGVETVTLAQVQEVLGAVSSETVAVLVDGLAERDVAAVLRVVQQLVGQGAGLAEFTGQLIEYLRALMLLQMTNAPDLLDDLPDETIRRMQGQATRITLPMTLHAIKRLSEALPELKGGYQPQLPLELALIESIRGEIRPASVDSEPSAQAVATSAKEASAAATASRSAPVSRAQTPAAVDKPTEAGDAETGKAEASEEADLPLDEAAIRKLSGPGWDQFQNTVRERLGHKVQASLRAVRDIAVSENRVAFAFGTNQFSHDMVSAPETMSKIVDLLSGYLGRSVRLECQMGDTAKLTGRLAVQQAAGQEGPDPLVEYAVENLRASVAE
ncbi:MAG: DNA polymerase III subunit gamma/tau [Caldilineaceae bacterium]|nr:DNA polymerase III subunit gamma/tau [Caldilineaceae bacterium]